MNNIGSCQNIKIIKQEVDSDETTPELSTPTLLLKQYGEYVDHNRTEAIDIVKEELDLMYDSKIKTENMIFLKEHHTTCSSSDKMDTFNSFLGKTIKEEIVDLDENKTESDMKVSVAELPDLPSPKVPNSVRASINYDEGNSEEEKKTTLDCEVKVKTEASCDFSNFSTSQVNNVLATEISAREHEMESRNMNNSAEPAPKEYLWCPNCRKRFPRSPDPLAPDDCKICGGKLLNTNDKSFKCEVCGRIFRQASSLTRHARAHTIDKSYKCHVCQKRFSCLWNARVHMRTHTNEKPYVCQVCEKGFSTSSSLTTHTRIHTNEKPYKCHICEKSFNCLSAATTHKRTHTNEKPYQCEVCERKFTRSSTVKTHMRTHTMEKPYKCEVCEKSFNYLSNARTHMRTHTDEKPYKCQVCDKSFSCSSNATTHMRTHTSEKPYKCDTCEKSFSCSSNATTHMRTHTMEKPYKCEVCQKAFNQSSILTVHMRTHANK